MGLRTTQRNSPRSARPQRGGQTTHQHLHTLRRAGHVIKKLDTELRTSLGQTELLTRAVRECGNANAAVGNKLRELSKRLSTRERNSPVVKSVMDSSTKLQQLAARLTKTLSETRGLQSRLREARNEVGEARDAAARAHTETSELREELKRAGEARAEAVLEPIVAKIATILPQVAAVDAALTEYRAGIDWRTWQPQRHGTNLHTALAPVYTQLGITASANTRATAAPPQIKAILAAVGDKYADAMPATLEPTLQALHRSLGTLSDTVRASLRAVQRVPGAFGGKRTRRRRTQRKTRKSRKSKK